MILYEACGCTENHTAYENLSVANLSRQYDFLRSIVFAAIEIERPFLSQVVIKSLNFHAITCLHTNAGEYRPCAVTVGEYTPPQYFRVQALMDDFVNVVNRNWDKFDPVALAAYVLWRLNWIHPFINGNGRTARVTCYYILCLRMGGWLPGKTILPELIKNNRDEYVDALRAADVSNFAPLHGLLSRLLNEQMQTV